MSNRKFSCIILSILFVVFTIVTFIFLSVVLSEKIKHDNFVEVDATISDIEYLYQRGERGHDVFVTYQYNGSFYESRINVWDSSMYIRKSITILVNPDAPYNITTKGTFSFLCIFMFAFGGVSVVLLIVLILTMTRRVSPTVIISGFRGRHNN